MKKNHTKQHKETNVDFAKVSKHKNNNATITVNERGSINLNNNRPKRHSSNITSSNIALSADGFTTLRLNGLRLCGIFILLASVFCFGLLTFLANRRRIRKKDNVETVDDPLTLEKSCVPISFPACPYCQTVSFPHRILPLISGPFPECGCKNKSPYTFDHTRHKFQNKVIVNPLNTQRNAPTIEIPNDVLLGLRRNTIVVSVTTRAHATVSGLAGEKRNWQYGPRNSTPTNGAESNIDMLNNSEIARTRTTSAKITAPSIRANIQGFVP